MTQVKKDLESAKEVAADPEELVAANKKQAELASMLEQAEAQRTTVAEKLSALRKQVRERDAAEESKSAESTALNEELVELRSKLRESEEAHESYETQIQQLRADAEAAIPTERPGLGSDSAELSSAKEAVKEANSQLAVLQSELDRVNAQAAEMDLSDDLSAAEARIKELEGENAGLRTAVDGNQSAEKISSLQSDIVSLKSQLSDKLNEIHSSSQTDHSAAIKVDIEQLKSQFALASEQHSGKLESRLSQLVEQVSKSNEAQHAAIADSKETARLQSALDKATAENQKLQVKVGAAESQKELIAQLKQQLVDEQMQKKDMAKSVKDAESALKIAESKLADAHKSSARSESVGAELKLMRSELAGLKAKPSSNGDGDSVKQVLAENRNLNAQIIELTKAVTSSQVRIAELAARPVSVPTEPKKAKAKLTKKTSKPAKKAKVPAKKDDLKKIEGIGPKIQTALRAAGISTYAQLSKSKVGDLKAILEDAGLASHNPSTWKRQASMANKGHWEALKVYQDALDGGVVR